MSSAGSSRGAHAVGIDLGTTNCALAHLSLRTASGEVRNPPTIMPVPQVVLPGSVDARPLLPSFLYLPHKAEFPAAALRLPWDEQRSYLVGTLARDHGSLTPIRLVSSAKSWLCHPAIDRRADLLPLGSPAEVPKISPLEASARYLGHLREAWNATWAQQDPEQALELQEVTLTVPASFDAVARELTVQAAQQAGIPRFSLLEEPQAALYAWVEALGDRWRKLVHVGDLILVCDVGGGTTDFSLIAVVDQDGELGLQRVAVGDHLLLGGDNMDLTLAHLLFQKLTRAGKKLDSWQFQVLTHGARVGKEALYADPRRGSWPITVPSRGSRLFGGTIKTELTREELTATLTDGFFPLVEADARPTALRRTGLTQLGLPFASDPAITRHLAHFLTRHRLALESTAAGLAGQGLRLAGRAFLHPTAILFNGGVMKATPLKQRVLELIRRWVAAEQGQPPQELPGGDPDLAVAQGGACYGRVRQGLGIRIRGGTARAYYIGIETAAPAVPGLAPPLKALCLAPMGLEEGSTVQLPEPELGLVVGEPAEFRLFASSVRRDDQVGQFVEQWDDELEETPPLTATLPVEEDAPHGAAGQVVPVRLQAHVSELGTLDLNCVTRQGGTYRLTFNLRAAAAPDLTEFAELEVEPEEE